MEFLTFENWAVDANQKTFLVKKIKLLEKQGEIKTKHAKRTNFAGTLNPNNPRKIHRL